MRGKPRDPVAAERHYQIDVILVGRGTAHRPEGNLLVCYDAREGMGAEQPVSTSPKHTAHPNCTLQIVPPRPFQTKERWFPLVAQILLFDPELGVSLVERTLKAEVNTPKISNQSSLCVSCFVL